MSVGKLAPRSPFGLPLAEQLIGAADSIRQIATEFGLRNKRVFLVWIGWTADVDGDGVVSSVPVVREGAPPEALIEAVAEADLDPDVVGVGRSIVLCEVELLPTPLVSSLNGVGKDQDSVGLTERGGVQVSQISARYSEDLLMGLVEPFRDPEKPDNFRPAIEFFWEIREDRPAGFVAPGYSIDPAARQELLPVRRRFHVSSTPEREPSAFQWIVNLNRADGERTRSGEVEDF